jgi:hypothetical protein
VDIGKVLAEVEGWELGLGPNIHSKALNSEGNSPNWEGTCIEKNSMFFMDGGKTSFHTALFSFRGVNVTGNDNVAFIVFIVIVELKVGALGRAADIVNFALMGLADIISYEPHYI